MQCCTSFYCFATLSSRPPVNFSCGRQDNAVALQFCYLSCPVIFGYILDLEHCLRTSKRKKEKATVEFSYQAGNGFDASQVQGGLSLFLLVVSSHEVMNTFSTHKMNLHFHPYTFYYIYMAIQKQIKKQVLF